MLVSPRTYRLDDRLLADIGSLAAQLGVSRAEAVRRLLQAAMWSLVEIAPDYARNGFERRSLEQLTQLADRWELHADVQESKSEWR